MPDEASTQSPIVIKTPMGDCEVPFDRKEIRSFVRSIMEDAETRITLQDTDIMEFLEAEEISEIDSDYQWWEEHTAPSKLKDFQTFINEKCEISDIKGYSRRKTNYASITHRQFDFPSGKESVPAKATYFVKMDGIPYVIDINPVEGINIEIQFYFDPSLTTMESFTKAFEEFHTTKGVLKNAKFDAELDFLKIDKVGWEDIVLTDDQRKHLERNIIRYVNNIHLYKEKGLPTSRGCLITGPPGTGKTLCCQTIMSQVNCTFIYITSDNVNSRGQIADLYDLARSLAPTIVVVEDIDTLGAIDRQHGHGDHPLLGEFLNCLAGVEKNEGVITIATTNYPQHLDKALVDRPGRFDVRLDFGLPDEKLRKTIFERYLKDMKHGKVDYEGLIKLTAGMTGAHLKEIVMLAYTQELEAKDYTNGVKVNNKTLMESAKLLAKNREKYNYHVGKKKENVGSMHL